jgi:hypothetical protein
LLTLKNAIVEGAATGPSRKLAPEKPAAAPSNEVPIGKPQGGKNDEEAAAIINRGAAAGRNPTSSEAASVAARAKGPGEWRLVPESMSPRARAYQTQITGHEEVYVVNGVKFDGFANGTLLEAKGPGYVRFVRGHGFHEWFTKLPNILEQAHDQVIAAGGLPVEWHVADLEMVVALRKVFAAQEINISIVHTPAMFK